MKRSAVLSLSLFAVLPALVQAQTLEECQQAAERNYPLIGQYGLIEKTAQLSVANVAKGWLPQVQATAQATLQSDVTAWPEQMQAMMTQMGIGVKGLKKDQYRVGIDVSQTLFDGGDMSSRQAVVRQQAQVQRAQAEVSVYAVRQRVNEMYFSLLLIDQQIKLNNDLQTLLEANEKKLASMHERGTAARSDYQSVKAERLGVAEQLGALRQQRATLLRLLSVLCGMEVSSPVKPAPTTVVALQANCRPELKAFDAQLRLADAQQRQLDAALMPRLSVFASGFYGYPGYNMFNDMLHHDWSWNGMVGARLTWNIGALYTRKNDKARLQQQRLMAENSRQVFLFNNRLEQLQQSEAVERYRKQMEADVEIIELRHQIRLSAESKLAHGIIDVNDLVKELNNENAARVQQSIHEIEMLKEMYNLKYTTNNEEKQ